MNTIDTAQLLNQLRLAAAQAKGVSSPSAASSSEPGATDFSSLLKQSIDTVNGMQETSNQLKTAFERGEPQVSLPDVMIASGKAELAFQTMVQVRNRVVEAYQEVMRMPV